MSADAATILAGTTLLARPGPYRLAAWPLARRRAVWEAVGEEAAGTAFLLADDREVTALLPEARLAGLPEPEHVTDGFSLLTLDATMPWDVLGVLALVSGALAGAGVPTGSFAAFSRDHLVVPRASLEAALDALRPLVAGVSVVDG